MSRFVASDERESLEASIVRWEGTADRLTRALAEAVDVIEKLAEQQAMPDGWYEESLARFRELIGRGQSDR